VKAWLSICRCPVHSGVESRGKSKGRLTGFWSISVDTENGGTRLTRGKCCGRWEQVWSTPLDAQMIADIVTELECVAEDIGEEVSRG
jgi:hypothetical protein